ncbi:MAG: chaperonin GroEL [Candidatus Dormibacteraeota bacterium]|nr:chaperonin GroEL [Candidatus Dormibacteraeota bacterium]
MPAKELRFDEEARAALKRGAESVAQAVSVTLGPRGRAVVLDKKFGPPVVTNDGVTIARDLEFDDPFENMGAQLLKEAAIKTNDVAGDGTTTATVLARAMIDEGLQNLAAGASPTELRRGMLVAMDAAVADIRKRSHAVSGNDDIRRVATISAADAEVGGMIADAFAKVGNDGVVSVEEANGLETEVEVVEGMQFDRGYVSAYMITDQQSMEAVLENARVLVTDAKISAVADLLPALETSLRAGRPLLVVAEDVQAEALATLVVNKMRGTVNAVAVKAPAFGERREAMLQDIAVLTSATVISEKTGLRLDQVREDQLGSAGRITVTKDDTTIVRGGGSKDAINARCEEIRRQIDETTSDWDREKLQERLAKLTGGVAVIRVGAPTEVELKERKARVEDAVAATRAAIEEGVVVGGGVALIRAVPVVTAAAGDGDAAVGARIVARALTEPLRVIGRNAGVEGAVVVNHVSAASGDEGFDAVTERYVDLPSNGIVDPTKVVVAALTNATSIATMLLTTEALIADAPEKEEPAAAGHGHAHGGGMGAMGGVGGMGGMDDDFDY